MKTGLGESPSQCSSEGVRDHWDPYTSPPSQSREAIHPKSRGDLPHKRGGHWLFQFWPGAARVIAIIHAALYLSVITKLHPCTGKAIDGVRLDVAYVALNLLLCVCVHVCERQREREREGEVTNHWKASVLPLEKAHSLKELQMKK